MNPKRKIILISLIFGVVNISAIILFLIPFLKEIKGSFSELAVMKKELASSQELLENVNKIKDTYRNIEADLNKIDNLFVDQAVPVGIITFWEDAAQNCDVKINPSSITLRNADEKEKKSSPWNFLLFQMSLEGSFSNFLKFLEKNENGPYLSELRTITVRSRAGFPGDVNAGLGGKIFTK